jgi:hypothetical protein
MKSMTLPFGIALPTGVVMPMLVGRFSNFVFAAVAAAKVDLTMAVEFSARGVAPELSPVYAPMATTPTHKPTAANSRGLTEMDLMRLSF